MTVGSIGDVEMFTINIETLLKHKTELLKDERASKIIPLLSSLKITKSFFGFGENTYERNLTLEPNKDALWMFLALHVNINKNDVLAFNSNDYNHIINLLSKNS